MLMKRIGELKHIMANLIQDNKHLEESSHVASLLWGSSGVSSGSGVEVVEWSVEYGRGGNKSYLTDYEEIDGGFVAFRDFKLTDERHVLHKVPRKDNMYSVDLKNVVLQGGRKPTLSFMKPFGCPVTFLNTIDHLDFKLTDERHVLHKVPRKDNMYSVDLKNVVLQGGIENLIDLRVKVIRCDNGTKFKNRVMNQFCDMNGIEWEFNVARTSP
nr:putative ribonuclease H-like domain-containing protein [Tanacetum cinerariifolium]